jgi:hypothetical protein
VSTLAETPGKEDEDILEAEVLETKPQTKPKEKAAGYKARPGVAGEPSVTVCQKAGCDEDLPSPGEEGFHKMRLYCDAHQVKKDRQRLPKSVAPPPEPVPDELAELVAGAEFYLNWLPLLLQLVDHDNKANFETGVTCPDAITSAIPAISLQMAKLCEYHPGLKTFLTPADSVGEGMIWAGLGMATWPVLAVVLVNHNLLPKEMAEKLAAKMLSES